MSPKGFCIGILVECLPSGLLPTANPSWVMPNNNTPKIIRMREQRSVLTSVAVYCISIALLPLPLLGIAQHIPLCLFVSSLTAKIEYLTWGCQRSVIYPVLSSVTRYIVNNTLRLSVSDFREKLGISTPQMNLEFLKLGVWIFIQCQWIVNSLHNHQ